MSRPKPSANVYTVPPGTPFLRTLAQGLFERYWTGEPLEFARVTVFLPTRRSVRSLGEELRLEANRRDMAAILLPEICALGDVDEDELLLSLPRNAGKSGSFDLPPAIGEIRRQILLAQLIERWAEDRHQAGDIFATMNPAQAIVLAGELASFLDRLHTEDRRLTGLADLVPARFSEHWEKTVRFLTIVSDHWPDVLREEGGMDPGQRRSRLLRMLAHKWSANPPDDPVIAAGSTGSIPATSDLLAVIARLPKGAVLLPGLDLDLDEASWAQLDPPHPQYGLRHLLGQLGVRRGEVANWREPEECAAAARADARARLWSTVFRPAATTEQWPDLAAEIAKTDALSGLNRVDADDPAQEAGIIASILRHTLETPGRTAALVTPDRDLARRVAVELRRWQIDIDDSAGQPLAGTRAGTFLRCLLEAVEARFSPVALLSLLKHDWCRLGLTEPDRRAAISTLERNALRGLTPPPGLAVLKSRLQQVVEVPLPDRDAALRLLDRLDTASKPLARLTGMSKVPLRELALAHLEVAESVSEAPGDVSLWESEDGEAARNLLDQLIAQEDGPEWPFSEYVLTLTHCLQSRPVHWRGPGHPRLFIWGPLEARLQHTDVMVLGGLNEGSWPAPPKPDPWVNRRMQSELGLPDPERRIGQAAHDLTQLACAQEVWLTRSAKKEGAPQLPSRWLLRLDAVLKAAGLQAGILTPDPSPASVFRALDRRPKRQRISDPRPAPPVHARPRQLPVTAIETLVRDPYAVYARYVLGLKALDLLEGEPGAGERGSFVHDTLHRFIKKFATGLPTDKSLAHAALLDEGRAALIRAIGPEWLHPATRTFWWARFEAAAGWFVEWEYVRRSAGTHPLLHEVEGELSLNTGLGFTLKARADRIDRLASGAHAVLDYKTGSTPTDKEVAAGFAPQLPLEGAILQAGGFADAGVGRVESLLYVRLTGGRTPGEERIITGGTGSAESGIAEALSGLNTLVAQYHDEQTPFLSRPHVQFIGQRSDYDHLARLKEWSAGGEEGAE